MKNKENSKVCCKCFVNFKKSTRKQKNNTPNELLEFRALLLQAIRLKVLQASYSPTPFNKLERSVVILEKVITTF